MFESDPEILPGWKMSFDELSDGSYKVRLTHHSGRKVEETDEDFDQAVRRSQEDAFEIEKHISHNWGRFLFDTSRMKLSGKTIVEEVYHSMHFGSWLIELPKKRLVYDGKDGWLLYQLKNEDGWKTTSTVKDIKGLSIYQVDVLIHEMKV